MDRYFVEKLNNQCKKIIVYGDNLEFCMWNFEANKESKCKVKESSKEQQKRNKNRMKDMLIKLAINNFEQTDYFCTVTYKRNERLYSRARKDYEVFLNRLKKLYPEIKYLGIMERQKRGAWHLHIILRYEGYLDFKIINRLWNNRNYFDEEIQRDFRGYIKIENRLKGIKDAAAYISKYISKSLDSNYNKGKKLSFRSRNLDYPLEWRDEKQIREIVYNYRNSKIEKVVHIEKDVELSDNRKYRVITERLKIKI